MQYLAILAGVLLLALIIEAVRQYRKTPGTSLLTAFYNSATIAWARIVQIISSAVLVVMQSADSIASVITDPATSDAIKGVVAAYKPEATTIAVLVIALAGSFEAARRRNLNTSNQQ